MPGQLQNCWPFPWSYLVSFPLRRDLRCSQCLLRALGLLGLGEGSSLGSAEVMGGKNACKDMTKKEQEANPWLLGGSPLKCHSAEGSPAQSALQPTSLSLMSLSVDVGKSPHVPYVYVSHHGEVQNLKPIQVMTACSLDIYNFPFDVQNCSLTFTSWLHHSECRAARARVPGERAGLAGRSSAAPCRRRLVPLDGPSGSGKRAGRAARGAGAGTAGAWGGVPPALTSPPPPSS